MLIDCGVLARDAAVMTRIVEHIRDTVRNGKTGAKRASTSSSARTSTRTTSRDSTRPGRLQQRLRLRRRVARLDREPHQAGDQEDQGDQEEGDRQASAGARQPARCRRGRRARRRRRAARLQRGRRHTGSGRIAEALEYLKLRGKDAGDLRVPRAGRRARSSSTASRAFASTCSGRRAIRILLKGSEVTEQMKQDGVIYHLSRAGDAGIDALSAAVSATPGTDWRIATIRSPRSIGSRAGRGSARPSAPLSRIPTSRASSRSWPPPTTTPSRRGGASTTTG